MNRREEVRQLLKMTPDEVIQKAGNQLIVCEDLDQLYRVFAEDIAEEIRRNNIVMKPTRIIVPVGPTGQYPYLVEKIRKDNISLENCWFFFMDEYCDENGEAASRDYPLSLKRIALNKFLIPLKEYTDLNQDHVFFPDGKNITKLGNIIEEVGGIDTCYGGIGIHGHLAFNEPAPDIKNTGYRKVKLDKYTITINAIRARVGGNLECFPKEAFTIGMKQILNAKKIKLYCRNGTDFDWANTALRIALFGEPGDDYPVTYIRDRNYVIVTDRDTLSSPIYFI